MKVYSLTGKAGTGKSYHAMNVAKEKNIDAIIDDGLFIYRSTVVEGSSAKRSKTKIGAVKVALFQNEEMRDKVAAAIKKKNPESILILGTSVEMADRIMNRLDIVPDEIERIYIEDITTADERELASEQRNVQGKHAIPAPSLQLKHNFAGYYFDPLRLFKGRDVGAAAERTVVRPSFSYMGDYIINEKAINDIIRIVVRETAGIHKVLYISHVQSAPEEYGVLIAISTRRGYPMLDSAEQFQKNVHNMIEKMTAFNVVKIDIEIRGIG